MTERGVPLLMRAADALLYGVADETGVLAEATRLLGEHFGYDERYVLLRDGDRETLRMAMAEGKHAERREVRDFVTTFGKGLTGTAAVLRRVVNVGDVAKDPRYINVLPGIRSEIVVPLLAGGRVLGVLSVASERKEAFDAADEELLSGFGLLLALAVSKARDAQARRRDIAELQAINDVVEKAVTLDVKATVQTAADAFQRVTTSDSTAIYLWKTDRSELVCEGLAWDRRLYPPDYDRRMRPLRLGEGMTGWVAENRQAVMIDDIVKDPRALAVTGITLEQKSAIVVPLLVEDRLLGVIRAVKMGVGSYEPEHFRLATTLAHQAALAIAAVEAHREQSHRVDELRALEDVSRRLSESATLDDVLESALDGAMRITGADGGFIYRRGDDRLYRLAAARNVDAKALEAQPPNAPDSLTNDLLRSGGTICVADIQADPRAKSKAALGDRHAALGVPLRSEGHMHGALWLVHAEPGFFGEKQARQAEVLASHVGAALSRAHAFEEARRLSITDELTGCFNRRYLTARLGEEIARAQRYGHELAFVIVDSDALKKVNDRLGHEAGNKHLLEVARAIKAQVRATDIVARYGGDEFVVLQPEAGLEAGRATAERIREVAASASGDIATSVSIGVAAYPVNAKDAESLFLEADRALLKAKARGKNAVVVATPA